MCIHPVQWPGERARLGATSSSDVPAHRGTQLGTAGSNPPQHSTAHPSWAHPTQRGGGRLQGCAHSGSSSDDPGRGHVAQGLFVCAKHSGVLQ